MEHFTDLQVFLAKGPRKSLYCSNFRICAADVDTAKCLLFNLFFVKAWILTLEGVQLWKQATYFRCPEVIHTIPIPEEGHYFLNVLQSLHLLIAHRCTQRPHHANNEFCQLRNVQGPILCLLLYQIQIQDFRYLVPQSSVTRQQERQEGLQENTAKLIKAS